MGLLDKLTDNETILTPYAGKAPPINPLATKYSKMHVSSRTNPGYSLTGANTSEVNTQYNQYVDGVVNSLPSPSKLDLNGLPPKVAGKWPYMDNLPGISIEFLHNNLLNL